jgi:hypothetical protein
MMKGQVLQARSHCRHHRGGIQWLIGGEGTRQGSGRSDGHRPTQLSPVAAIALPSGNGWIAPTFGAVLPHYGRLFAVGGKILAPDTDNVRPLIADMRSV